MDGELPEDLWQPLYDMIPRPTATMDLWWVDNLEYISMYRRACQRWYGDNRPDHIKW